MEDFFVVDIPVFVPEYDKDKKYGWTNYKDELWDLLKETTHGYCMYCYDRIWINQERRGQIEHGIEKKNSMKRLQDCVPNLGISCENCNQKYKKRGEQKRRLSQEQICEFEKGECTSFECKEMCTSFRKIRRAYVKQGKIMIQPFETKLEENGNVLRIQYDLLQCKYIPMKSYHYTEQELEVIRKHIELFALNSPERKNYEIAKYCKNVIDNRSLMLGIDYNNLIVDLFREKLVSLHELEKSNQAVQNDILYGRFKRKYIKAGTKHAHNNHRRSRCQPQRQHDTCEANGRKKQNRQEPIT